MSGGDGPIGDHRPLDRVPGHGPGGLRLLPHPLDHAVRHGAREVRGGHSCFDEVLDTGPEAVHPVVVVRVVPQVPVIAPVERGLVRLVEDRVLPVGGLLGALGGELGGRGHVLHGLRLVQGLLRLLLRLGGGGRGLGGVIPLDENPGVSRAVEDVELRRAPGGRHPQVAGLAVGPGGLRVGDDDVLRPGYGLGDVLLRLLQVRLRLLVRGGQRVETPLQGLGGLQVPLGGGGQVLVVDSPLAQGVRAPVLLHPLAVRVAVDARRRPLPHLLDAVLVDTALLGQLAHVPGGVLVDGDVRVLHARARRHGGRVVPGDGVVGHGPGDLRERLGVVEALLQTADGPHGRRPPAHDAPGVGGRVALLQERHPPLHGPPPLLRLGREVGGGEHGRGERHHRTPIVDRSRSVRPASGRSDTRGYLRL